MGSPAPERVVDTVRAALTALEPGLDEHTRAIIHTSVALLANVRTRITEEVRWQAEETAAIETFVGAVAASAGDASLSASLDDLRASGTKPASERYRAASGLLCEAIAVIGAAPLDRLVPELEQLLRERVAHEVAITGDAFG